MDTGARASFIWKDVIPNNILNIIKTSRNVNVLDENNSKAHTSGTDNLTVEVGNIVQIVNLNVVERFATNILLRHYCDRHIEAIKQIKRIVGLDDGTNVPIIRNNGRRSRNMVSLP